jgi:flagellar hook-basal body complex protein FliE
MSPISFNGGPSQSPFLQMRSEFPLRKSADQLAGGQIGDLPSMPSAPGEISGKSQAGFDNILGSFVREVNAKQTAAGDAVTGLLSGQNVPLHQAMISMEEASVSFQLMVEVRNKLLEGYQELMRMQV